jgi:phosphoglycerate kinase
VIGGGMANTFLHAQGVPDRQVARREATWPRPRCGIMEKADTAAKCAIILPVDAVVASQFAANAPSQAYGLDAIPAMTA